MRQHGPSSTRTRLHMGHDPDMTPSQKRRGICTILYPFSRSVQVYDQQGNQGCSFTHFRSKGSFHEALLRSWLPTASTCVEAFRHGRVPRWRARRGRFWGWRPRLKSLEWPCLGCSEGMPDPSNSVNHAVSSWLRGSQKRVVVIFCAPNSLSEEPLFRTDEVKKKNLETRTLEVQLRSRLAALQAVSPAGFYSRSWSWSLRQ